MIVAAIQIMMIANIVGLPISALWARLNGQREPGSSLLYELGLPFSANVLWIPSLFHALFNHLSRKEHLTFISNQT